MAHLLGDELNILQKINVHTNDVTCLEFYGNSVLCTGSG